VLYGLTRRHSSNVDLEGERGWVISEDQRGRGRGRVRRLTLREAAERAGLVVSSARRGLEELREHDPPLVWGDVDATTGEELWWLLSSGLSELDRLEAASTHDHERASTRTPRQLIEPRWLAAIAAEVAAVNAQTRGCGPTRACTTATAPSSCPRSQPKAPRW
jgi:hypothetical protein